MSRDLDSVFRSLVDRMGHVRILETTSDVSAMRAFLDPHAIE